MNELKENIDKFNDYIKLIIEKLNKVINNVEIYYNISNNYEDINYCNNKIIKNLEIYII